MNFVIGQAYASGMSHCHHCYEIIVCVGGAGTFVSDRFSKEIACGDMIVIPPNTPHYVIAQPSAERVYINGELEQFFNLDHICVISDSKNGEGVALANMIYDNRYMHVEYAYALINALAHYLLNHITMDSKIHAAVKEIVEKITNDFSNQAISLSQFLKESGYSEDYIRAQFKQITGKAPIEFLTTVRITHACYLIDTYQSALSLAEISEQCGYTDYVYFSKQFKRITGKSPRKYFETISASKV